MQSLLQMLSGSSYSESQVFHLLFSQEDTAAYAASFPQAFPAGTMFQYQTTNFALLSYMLRFLSTLPPSDVIIPFLSFPSPWHSGTLDWCSSKQ